MNIGADSTNETSIEENKEKSFFDHITFAVNNICSYIYKNSYVFTNILMMVRIYYIAYKFKVKSGILPRLGV